MCSLQHLPPSGTHSRPAALPLCACSVPGAANKKGYSVGSFGSAEEGAAARDVAIVWRCLVLGVSPHKAYEKFNLPLDG